MGSAKKLRKCRKGHHPLWLCTDLRAATLPGGSELHLHDRHISGYKTSHGLYASGHSPGSMEGTDSAQGSGRSVQGTVVFGGLHTSQY